MFDAAEYYYSNILGRFPEDEKAYKTTANMFGYLGRNGFVSPCELFGRDIFWPLREILSHKDIPVEFWRGSLLKPGCFYFHRTFQIRQDMPFYDSALKKEIVKPFFLEMKIRFTMKDLLDYFYRKCDEGEPFRDDRRDGARFKTLLDRFSGIKFMEGIDFIMAAIDYACASHMRITDVFSLERAAECIYEDQKRKAEEAKAYGKAAVVWKTW